MLYAAESRVTHSYGAGAYGVMPRKRLFCSLMFVMSLEIVLMPKGKQFNE
jgi:hypothetical protein